MRITMVRALAKMKSLRLACPRSNWQESKLRVGVKRRLKTLREGSYDGIVAKLGSLQFFGDFTPISPLKKRTF
jgi:hypothetical protein